MNKTEYLVHDVADFRNWFAQCLLGQPVLFKVGECQYSNLLDAKDAYAWPLKAKAGLSNLSDDLPYIYPVVPPLAARANLASNTAVLDILQDALRAAFANECNLHLAGAIAAILHWGGVYTALPRGGNKPWLKRNYECLHTILGQVVSDYASGNDISNVGDLRFNAGMTKVYALLLDDFLIYDSRVAASLTWLVVHWWTAVKKMPLTDLPPHLQFGTLRANGAAQGHRNASPGIFREIARAENHYMWNVRANWLLSDALNLAGRASPFTTLRDVEAALFQMGDRVQ